MMTIARAGPADLDEILQLLNDGAAWLASRGLDQWQGGFSGERISRYVSAREAWLVRDPAGHAVATVRVSRVADADFWTPAEAADAAAYLSKLAVTRSRAGEGIGHDVTRWCGDYAARAGCDWLRLDAWRTNPGLHAYYVSRGWHHVRTVNAPRRHSGALFERPAVRDPAAAALFTLAGDAEGTAWAS